MKSRAGREVGGWPSRPYFGESEGEALRHADTVMKAWIDAKDEGD